MSSITITNSPDSDLAIERIEVQPGVDPSPFEGVTLQPGETSEEIEMPEGRHNLLVMFEGIERPVTRSVFLSPDTKGTETFRHVTLMAATVPTVTIVNAEGSTHAIKGLGLKPMGGTMEPYPQDPTIPPGASAPPLALATGWRGQVFVIFEGTPRPQVRALGTETEDVTMEFTG